MVTVVAWRRPLARNAVPGTSRAGALARVSIIQAGLVLIMGLAATGMARGNGAGGH